jgi:hypothetical protein
MRIFVAAVLIVIALGGQSKAGTIKITPACRGLVDEHISSGFELANHCIRFEQGGTPCRAELCAIFIQNAIRMFESDDMGLCIPKNETVHEIGGKVSFRLRISSAEVLKKPALDAAIIALAQEYKCP